MQLKKIISIGLIASLVSPVLTTGKVIAEETQTSVDTSNQEISVVPDVEFQRLIRTTLRLPDDVIVTKEVMENLTSLSIGNSKITDFTGLEYAINVTNIRINGQTLDSSLFPDLSSLSLLTHIDLDRTDSDNLIIEKLANITSLQSINIQRNPQITDVSVLANLPNLQALNIQFNGVSDFRWVNDAPKLTRLSATGQNTGRDNAAVNMMRSKLIYDSERKTITLPFAEFPKQLTNFDGYTPSFSTALSDTYFVFDGVEMGADRLTIDTNGLTINQIEPDAYENATSFIYNARYNNPFGTYEIPVGFTFYAISAGTYYQSFAIENDPIAGAPVNVHYVDEENNELAPVEELNGNVNESYQAQEKDIPDWVLKEVPDNVSGLFTTDLQTVTYVYEKKDGVPVTVYYQDEAGNELAPAEQLSGKLDFPYSTSEKELAGWVVKEVPANEEGLFTDKAQTVVYIYEKATAAPITVYYQDEEGHDIIPSEQLDGKLDAPYEASIKEIAGWVLKTSPENTKGLFTDKAQTIVYIYEKANGAPVTVDYQDTEGSKLSPSEQLTGQLDATYETMAKSFIGWELKQVPTNAKGLFTSENQSVVYIYQKQQPGTSISQIQPPFNTGNPLPATAKVSKNSLPETGEKQSLNYSLAGVGIMGLAVLAILRKRTKNK
ncbi:MucBP domain-containing protein [Carnobacterium sp.]|uniref:MucBP domain-containing protein n=1 Tax=Carnobacterium sp. TaxID=48221 RepID=UPI002FC8F9F1